MNFWDQQGNNQQYSYTQGQKAPPNQSTPQQPMYTPNYYGPSQYYSQDQTALANQAGPQQHVHAPYSPNQYTTMLSSLQQQTQQRQALGALAAASLTSLLNPSMAAQPYYPPPPPAPVNSRYIVPDGRGVIPYDDIYGDSATNKNDTVIEESGGSCCFRYYKTKKALDQHQKEHVHCQECPNFTGIRQLLADHMETTHGVARKNKKSVPDGVIPSNAPRLDTPEAIAKWIEERKKNWPSRANVERKTQLENEREARGELPKNQGTNNKRKERQSAKKDKTSKKPRTEPASNSLVNYASDSDQEERTRDKADDDDDIMDLETDAISSKDPNSMGKVAIPTTNERPRKLCKYNMRGKCRRGDDCLFSHEKPANRNNQGKGKQREPPAEEFRKRPHLLKMLLTKEIRQEQNVILQCLRYIKENDFFGLDHD